MDHRVFLVTLALMSPCLGCTPEDAVDSAASPVPTTTGPVTAPPQSPPALRRALPRPPEINDPKEDQDDRDTETPGPGAEELDTEESLTPDQLARTAFLPPVDARSLSQRNLWVDRKRGRVYADGYVAMNRGPLEMFACPAGTKEHESVVAVFAKAQEVHAALLAIGAQVGTPVAYDPAFIPATGQRIRVWVCYFDKDGKFRSLDARDWIVQEGTKETLQEDWVFAGSRLWTDPADQHTYYQADGGDMICVSNFSTAMMDVPVLSSADTDGLLYSPYTDRIPPRGTPVRLILEPIALLTDAPEDEKDDPQPPTSDVLEKRG